MILPLFLEIRNQSGIPSAFSKENAIRLTITLSGLNVILLFSQIKKTVILINK